MSPARLHEASPWVIDTRALGLTHQHGPGLSHPLEITAPAPADVVVGDLAIAPEHTVQVAGLLEAVSEGVMVSGTAHGTAAGSCARCLRDISMDIDTEFRELYAYPDSLTAETTDADEVPRIHDDMIDLEPLVHDELVLAMPTIALCSPDCQGLCPDCGELLESVGPDHRHETIDPRWAALVGLLDSDSGEMTEKEQSGGDAGNSEEI